MDLISIYPFYNRQRALFDDNFWDLDNLSTIPQIYSMIQDGFDAPKPWSVVVDVRGFREHEVNVSSESTDKSRLIVSARHEDPNGDFQEMRRSVVVPKGVELDKVTRHFERGQLQLSAPRKRKHQLPKQLSTPQWKLSDDGQQICSKVSLDGFKTEDIHLQQQGRWITLEANHQSISDSEDGTSSNNSKRMIMRSLLPEGAKPNTLQAEFTASGELLLKAQTDVEKTSVPRNVQIKPMEVDN
jgi:HSP20 family molecular chaperone IbpA